MPTATSTIQGFDYKVMCAMHHAAVVGRVLELGADRGKCLDSRDDKCHEYWYVEVQFTDFQYPGEDPRAEPPTG
jgi:hypothetical protein